jgi:hypothetical protein
MKQALILLMGMGLALRAAGPFEFRELNETSIQLLENGKPVYVYNHGMTLKPGMPEDRRRACYLHPVWTPDGTVVVFKASTRSSSAGWRSRPREARRGWASRMPGTRASARW